MENYPPTHHNASRDPLNRRGEQGKGIRREGGGEGEGGEGGWYAAGGLHKTRATCCEVPYDKCYSDT